MLFDLRSAGRRRMVKTVYLGLAALMFMGFVFFCLLAIGWLLSRRRKSTPPTPSSARTRAIIGTMLASPVLSSDADGGRTRLIMGDTPGRRAKDLRSNWP